MGAIFAALTLPLLLLNSLGGLVGGIWLLALGEWELVLAGLAWAALAPLMLSILLLPGIGLAAAGASTRGFGAFVAELLSVLWMGALMIVTAAVIFDFTLEASQKGWHDVIPYLLLAYGAATSPWAAMAQRGGGMGDLAVVPLVSLQVSCIAMGYAGYSKPAIDLADLATVAATTFLIAVLMMLLVYSHAARRT